MPFIGKDWRSPGNLWVRTNSGPGWQKLSTLRRNLNRHVRRVARERISVNLKPDSDSFKWLEASFKDPEKEEILGVKHLSKNLKFTERPKRQYLFIPTNCPASKQRGKYLTVGEVLCCLDFCTALSDPKRFHYVCKVVELIIDAHFSTLCGSAMKYLFCILEEAVNIVESSHLFIHHVLTLVKMTKDAMLSDKRKYFGCQALYHCRIHLLGIWEKRLTEINLVERDEDGKPTLEDLPVECQRFLMQCFSEAADVIHLSQTNTYMYKLGNDPLLWQKLFFYHFTEAQLQAVLRVPLANQSIDWKEMFRKLRKRYEQKAEFACMLQKCYHCNCIFWQEGGHPCCGVSSEDAFTPGMEHKLPRTKDLSPKELMAIITNS